jgi:hypothetical protein
VSLTEPYDPVEVTELQLAFPADAPERMPAWDDLPSEWKDRNSDAWQFCLVNDLLHRGLDDVALVPAEGIDPERAWRHLLSITGSFAPRHEHKVAACAFLISRWFVGAAWQPMKVRTRVADGWRGPQRRGAGGDPEDEELWRQGGQTP